MSSLKFNPLTGTLDIVGKFTMPETINAKTIVLTDAGNTESLSLYHTGTYGQIQSSTSFVLAAPQGTVVTGETNQFKVQNTSNYTSFLINDTPTSTTLTTDDFGAGTKTITLSPSNKKLNIEGHTVQVSEMRTIASSTATGTTGEVCYDADYVYVCVATDTWKRSPLTTW